MYKLTDEQREMWEAFSIGDKIGLLARLYYSGSYGGSSSYKTQMADALLAISGCYDWPVRDERQIMLVQAMATKQEALQAKDAQIEALVTAAQEMLDAWDGYEMLAALDYRIRERVEAAIKEATNG